MAPKAKATASGRGAKPSKAQAKHARAKASRLKTELRRAEQVGRRTTLRVPRALEAELARVAEELKVSENEALIRLAQMGAITAKRQRDVWGVIGKRQAAVTESLSGAKYRALPAQDEMQEAILVDRD